MYVSWLTIVVCIATQLVTSALSELSNKEKAKMIIKYDQTCTRLKDNFKAPPIFVIAADEIIIGKTGAMGKSYGSGNQNYDLTVMPHCVLKGNLTAKEITVRNLGPGRCGPVNVEQNDYTPYLFFLTRTADPKVFDIMTLGAKKITNPAEKWSPVLTFFCKITNRKICTDNCDRSCEFETMGDACIEAGNNIIDIYKKMENDNAFPKATTTTKVPVTEKPTTKVPMTQKPTTKAVMTEKSAAKPNMSTEKPRMEKEAATTAATKKAMETSMTMTKVNTTNPLKTNSTKAMEDPNASPVPYKPGDGAVPAKTVQKSSGENSAVTLSNSLLLILATQMLLRLVVLH